jgi:hypothetical protein
MDNLKLWNLRQGQLQTRLKYLRLRPLCGSFNLLICLCSRLCPKILVQCVFGCLDLIDLCICIPIRTDRRSRSLRIDQVDGIVEAIGVEVEAALETDGIGLYEAPEQYRLRM